jgi:hypothetical protein
MIFGGQLEAERDLVQPHADLRSSAMDADLGAERDHAAAGDRVAVHARDHRPGMIEKRVDHVVEDAEEALHAGDVERATSFRFNPAENASPAR